VRAYANTPMGQVHYVEQGSGAPLMLLGPSKRSSRVYVDLIARLSSRYRVLAPDTLGFGNSDPLPPNATIELLAESMVRVLDAAGCERAHVYGLHTGNKIAAAMAARWPDRVDAVVLCGHSHSILPDRARRNEIIHGLVSDFLAAPSGDDIRQQRLGEWSALYRRITATWWTGAVFAADAATAIARAQRAVIDLIEALPSTPALYQANFAYDFAGDLARIRARTLVLEIATADEDRMPGRQGSHVTALISGSVLQTVHERGGHASTLEDRVDELAAILCQFLG
jgi:pimeloyl-ACP methyl ester carboxylesterase